MLHRRDLKTRRGRLATWFVIFFAILPLLMGFASAQGVRGAHLEDRIRREGVLSGDIPPKVQSGYSRHPTYREERALYRIFRDIRDGRLSPADGVREYLKSIPSPLIASVHSLPFSETGALRIPGVISFPSLARLCLLVTTYEGARAEFIREASPELKTEIAQMIGTGDGLSGRHPDIAFTILESAAQSGFVTALLRVAQLTELGTGTAPDWTKAETFYQAAADAGSANAAYTLAKHYEDGPNVEPDTNKARLWYERFFDLLTKGSHGADEFTRFFQDQIASGGMVAQLLATQVMRDTRFARAIADAYMCISCSGPINIKAAAKYYRIAAKAGDTEARYLLARILLDYPAFAERNETPRDVLRQNSRTAHYAMSELLQATLLSSEKEMRSAAAKEIDALCASKTASPQRDTKDDTDDGPAVFDRSIKDTPAHLTSIPTDCIGVLHSIATGDLGEALIAIGFHKLEQLATEQAADPDTPIAFPDSPIAFADVLAYFGDFNGAMEIYDHISSSDLKLEEFNKKESTIRRLTLRVPFDVLKTQTDGVERLLTFLAGKDIEYSTLLELARSGSGKELKSTQPRSSLSERENGFQRQLARGISNGLVSSSNALAESWAQEGNLARALDYELLSLNAELELDAVRSITEGKLSSVMSRVCHLSERSRRIASLGFRETSSRLAKDAVNLLQQVRQVAIALPLSLQSCFRNVATDEYRWLAHLFNEQGRLADMHKTLQMLSDFENDQSLGLRPKTLSKITLTNNEELVGRQLVNLRLALSAPNREYQQLKLKDPAKLSADERANLTRLESKVKRETEIYQKSLEILKEREQKSQEQEEGRLSSLNRLGPFLENLLRSGEKTALIHYVVLPDSLMILVLSDAYHSVTVRSLAGKPFTEAALDSLITAYRAAITDPNNDPTSISTQLYSVLIKPIEPLIQDANILLVSPDKQLRSIPFAALKNENYYLVERYQIGMYTETTFLQGLDHRTTAPKMVGFGVSEARKNFPPLPNAAEELRVAVGVVDGTTKGNIYLNNDFTVDTFQRRVAFPSTTRGLVHISSHFQLRETAAASELLLGQGTLSLQQIANQRVKIDLSSVEMLTLSACNTAATIHDRKAPTVQSLAHVFHSGGVRTVVASLWPVSDQSTPEFMSRFYTEREKKGSSTTAALRSAQLSFIKQSTEPESANLIPSGPSSTSMLFKGHSHPYYWAQFIVLGRHL